MTARSERAGARSGPPARSYLLAWAGLTAPVLLCAALTHAFYPRWLAGSPTRALPDQPSLVVDILANNLLVAVTPLLGGWLAARALARGRRLLATICLGWPILVISRSLTTLGVFGGGDLRWFAAASRWWLLELAALAVSLRTMVWLAACPERLDRTGREAINRALAVVVALLTAAALVEVLTA